MFIPFYCVLENSVFSVSPLSWVTAPLLHAPPPPPHTHRYTPPVHVPPWHRPANSGTTTEVCAKHILTRCLLKCSRKEKAVVLDSSHSKYIINWWLYIGRDSFSNRRGWLFLRIVKPQSKNRTQADYKKRIWVDGICSFISKGWHIYSILHL